MRGVDAGWEELEARTTVSSGKEDFLEVSLPRAGKMKDEGGINIGPLWAPRTLSLETNGLTDVFLTGLNVAFGRSCSLSLKAAFVESKYKKQTNKQTERVTKERMTSHSRWKNQSLSINCASEKPFKPNVYSQVLYCNEAIVFKRSSGIFPLSGLTWDFRLMQSDLTGSETM